MSVYREAELRRPRGMLKEQTWKDLGVRYFVHPNIVESVRPHGEGLYSIDRRDWGKLGLAR